MQQVREKRKGCLNSGPFGYVRNCIYLGVFEWRQKGLTKIEKDSDQCTSKSTLLIEENDIQEINTLIEHKGEKETDLIDKSTFHITQI